MSEAFDPEKVERVDCCNTCWGDTSVDWVRASDYDKLLALYREAVKPPIPSISLANEKKLNDWGFTYDGPKRP